MRDNLASYPDIALLIDGSYRPGSGSDALPVTDPSTGEVPGHIPAASEADIAAAIEAAHAAFPVWRATHPRKPVAILRRVAELGREGGSYRFDGYLVARAVSHKTSAARAAPIQEEQHNAV